MLSENIKTLRKQKGYSQEQLADKLNVVRQTVSKWEKGYSVPDADILEDMADIFEVQVSDLLGKEISTEDETTDIGELVKQLKILNDYLAEKVRRRKNFKRILKKVCSIVCISSILFSLYLTIGSLVSRSEEIFREETSVTLVCSLENEEYNVKINYWKDNNEIRSIANSNEIPATVRDILKSNEVFDKSPEEVITAIESYFTQNGGICKIKYEDLNAIKKIRESIKTEISLLRK